MNKSLIVVICVFAIISCNSVKKEEGTDVKEELVMYQFSEMALLMEEMYKFNEDLKVKIINNEDLGEFTDKFLNIHSAVLTDPKDRNGSFEIFSKAFIENQQAIFSVERTNAKEQFNTMVNSCVACHKTTCLGPIPKIEKLLIK